MIPRRAYRAACLVGAVIGLGTALSFFAVGDAFMGWFFVAFTALLWPAYLAYSWAERRRG